MYCNSKTYGRSCPFGPKKTHCHVDQNKCVWCGSKSIGPGCPFNPFSKYHQHGFAFNPLALESFQSGMVRGILMKKLSEPITEKIAFKLGLIDKSGNQLREPTTIEERSALTSVDKYILRLNKMSKDSIDLLNTKLYFENTENYSLDEVKKMYPIELDCKDEISAVVNKLFESVNKFTQLGISSEKIEKIIAESMLNVENENRVA
jgi:hypothetical protein